MKSYVFPGDIDPSIAAIGSRPFPYMRTDEFSGINLESEKMLLDLIHCSNGKTIIFTGSGTGAMSAVVENYVLTKKKAIVIDGGSFGNRWHKLCEYYGAPDIHFQVPFGKDLDYRLFGETVRNEKPDVLLCQHHETSSGQLFDLSRISDICHENDVSMVVDVISSFLAEPFDMDSLGIDICITSTQKGLNIPPGLSIVFLSSSLNGYEYGHSGYYWDFETNLSNLKRGQTPFSPATILYLQLHERLNQLIASGGEYFNITEVMNRCVYFRELCGRYGWTILAENPSFAITGFQTADNQERLIFKELLKEGISIMPGSIPGFYRVSHMGLQSEEELDYLAGRIHEIEKSIKKQI